jgi:hypothetical protein
MALADDVVHLINFRQSQGSGFGTLPGTIQLGHIGDGFNDADQPAVVILDDTGIFYHGHIMTILVPQKALFGLGLTNFQNSAFFDVGRAVFSKTPAALEQLTGLTQCLCSRITADTFHRRIPGRYLSLVIHGEDPISHGIDYSIDETGVPYIVGFFCHMCSLESVWRLLAGWLAGHQFSDGVVMSPRSIPGSFNR